MAQSGLSASTVVGEIVSIDAPGEGPFGMSLEPGESEPHLVDAWSVRMRRINDGF
jgi:hypothetical protein